MATHAQIRLHHDFVCRLTDTTTVDQVRALQTEIETAALHGRLAREGVRHLIAVCDQELISKRNIEAVCARAAARFRVER